MLRKLAVTITDNLATLFAVICLDLVAGKFWDWHYRLTEPERKRAANDFFYRVFQRERK